MLRKGEKNRIYLNIEAFYVKEAAKKPVYLNIEALPSQGDSLPRQAKAGLRTAPLY